MRNIAVVVLIVVVISVLLLNLIAFQVRQTESALVMTFGKPTRPITEPGLYCKWPTPIQTLVKYDSRLMLFVGDPEETNTQGGDPIIVTTYMIWKVDEPRAFREKVRDVQGAEKLLKTRLRDAQNKVIGRHWFSDFVNSDKDKVKFDEIEQELLAALAGPVKESAGIEIKMAGIKQLAVNKTVTAEVFDRMRADRQRKTKETLAQGDAEATKIRANAESKRKILLAAAEARAKAIRGQGDAEAAKYYKLLEDDPEFAMFLRNIDALKNILKERSTIVLPADSEPFKLLRGIPQIEPKQR